MVDVKIKLTWAPGPVTARIRREIITATRKGGERVSRETKENALNTTGKAATARAKLNGKTLAKRWNRGVSNLKNLKVINLGSKQIAFGGTLTVGRGKKKQTIDRIYWYGEPLHRWVQSSNPGTPPHKQTGTLQRSIAVQPIADGYRVKVGPSNKLKYGRIQELGGKGRFGTLPPRPYLEPSFNKVIPAILNDYRVAIAKATS